MSNETIPINLIIGANKNNASYGAERIMVYNGSKVKSSGTYGKKGSQLSNRGLTVAGRNRVKVSSLGNIKGVRRMPAGSAVLGGVGVAATIGGAAMIGAYAGRKLGQAVNRSARGKAANARFSAAHRSGAGAIASGRAAHGGNGGRKRFQVRDSRGRFK